MTAADKLRALAEAATPGPWHVILPGDLSWGERRKYRCVEFDKATGEDTSPLSPGNARLIAALNPTVVRALADLLDEIDREHVRSGGGAPDFGPVICDTCCRLWPCPIAKARDAIEKLIDRNAILALLGGEDAD